jgi:hypothetical protein
LLSLRYTTLEEILRGDADAFLHTKRAQCQRIHEVLYSHYVQYLVQAALAI